jgi:PAS domain S-box-containing protein
VTLPPTIVVVDDSADVRTLVRAQIRMSKRLEVIGEGMNGLDAVSLASRHRPDVMLLDVSMPVVDGLEALPKVLEASPRTRVVMYSGFDETGLAAQSLDLGAAAFVSKAASFGELLGTLVEQVGDRDVDGESEVPPAKEVTALDDHLERFREVFQDAAIGMATMTLAGRVVRANRSLAQLLDVPAEELTGVALADLAEEPQTIDDALLSIDAGETIVQVEHRMRSRSDRYYRSTLSPVIDARGRPLYHFLQVQDITEQQVAQAALRRAEVPFRLLVEAVQDYAIFMLDPDGHISSWNAGAERIKGYTADEIIGQHFRVFYPPDKQESGHPEFELEEALREGTYEEEGWRIRRDGTRFWASVTITAVHDPDGALVGYAKVTRDTTERRDFVEQLAEANRQLAEVAEQQADFFSLTAHELRTPVSVIDGASRALAERADELGTDEQRELTLAVARSAEQLRRLLDDLLTASRLQARRLELAVVDVDLTEQLQTMARTIRRGTDAVIEVDAEPGLIVRADPVRLSQIIDNLVLNAVRHGQPPVRIVARSTNGNAEVLVHDEGAGVSEDVQERLFERFATGSRHGTGLGLFLVRELARAHGGDATYRPSDGTFVVTLPRAT